MLSLITETAEHAAEGGLDPYAVGAIAMAIELLLIFGLLAFGKGREHS